MFDGTFYAPLGVCASFDIAWFEAEIANDPVAHHLVLGRARIARGWCQGVKQDAYGRVCAMGALPSFVSGTGWSTAWRDAVYALIDEIPVWESKDGHGSNRTLTMYNDEPGRTQTEMIGLFDRAIRTRLEPNHAV